MGISNRKKVKKSRGLSDNNLMKLWRKAVLIVFGGRCFFCRTKATSAEVECHHTVKRKNLLLRYSYRNGVPACKWKHSGNYHLAMSCHQYAETPMGKMLITRYQESFLKYLNDRSGTAKQYFVEHGISRADYLMEMYLELKAIIGGGDASEKDGLRQEEPVRGGKKKAPRGAGADRQEDVSPVL